MEKKQQNPKSHGVPSRVGRPTRLGTRDARLQHGRANGPRAVIRRGMFTETVMLWKDRIRRHNGHEMFADSRIRGVLYLTLSKSPRNPIFR